MDQLLRICGPSDLHSLSITELQALADEIREVILSCVSEVGGHLAASLGAVELTVALHSVLDSPRDKIIWDVGHQAYAHKIITGRAECFNTIRQYGGLSGFPCRAESEHDVVGTGHASTSISYGLGLVEAARLSGRSDGHVVCVMGDGALTGGVAFEAMNQAGQLRTPLVVVLNDNQMSIKPNVGAFQLYLNRFRLDPGLTRLREDMEHTIARIPAIGARAYSLGKDVKESMKAFLGPGLIFEELGFAYIGVVNGHDIGALRVALQQAMDTQRPVLVHVRTVKGKGYEPAEEQPAEYHGTGPFTRSNGERKRKPGGATYTEAFGRVLVREARRDPRVVAVTAAMTQGTGLEAFEAEFPARLYDVGIAEEHAVVFSAGLALAGMRPVVAIYSTFLQRAFDMLVQDVALQHIPVVFALDRAGLVGDDGPTHHGAFDLSFLRMIPGLVVMAPSNHAQLQHMVHTALTHPGPVALRYPRGLAAAFDEPRRLKKISIGTAEVLREGREVALVGIGTGVGLALQAADLLESTELRPTVVDARFVKPLDTALLDELAETHGRVVTIEENVLAGGFGSAVAEHLADSPVRVRRFGLPDSFVAHGDRERLLADLGLTAESIAAAVLEREAGLAHIS
ncbi:MAG TPA: 1-deoxy-D-xylulose-5-phosphate synthase [Thermoleophilia bacterium]|nr:1-deoxy-D-xylulose-5-phosphate synthase [Thermoleophilia bacterium]